MPKLGINVPISGRRSSALWIPKLDASNRSIRCRAVHLRNVWRRMQRKERLDRLHGSHEASCQLGHGNASDDDEQSHLELHYSCEFVGNVPSSTVVRYRDSSIPAAMFKPLFVAAIGREQVDMTFDAQTSLGEDGRKLLAEISIREVGPSHAARE